MNSILIGLIVFLAVMTVAYIMLKKTQKENRNK